MDKQNLTFSEAVSIKRNLLFSKGTVVKIDGLDCINATLLIVQSNYDERYINECIGSYYNTIAKNDIELFDRATFKIPNNESYTIVVVANTLPSGIMRKDFIDFKNENPTYFK